MAVPFACIVPHPPLIVPEVGAGQERAIRKTVDSCHEVARQIAAVKPDTIIIISPHATSYADYFHISPGREAFGHLSQFGAREACQIDYDQALVERICQLCEDRDFPAGTEGERAPSLDHATVVPLHFIRQTYPEGKFVRIGISGLSRQAHYRFGILLREAADSLNRRVVIMASGDMSHKLKEDGPYGLAPQGAVFDAALVEIMRSGDFGAFFTLDETLCERAGQCGLAGFIIMAGALDGRQVAAHVYSYEGPFGVGYAVAGFTTGEVCDERRFLTGLSDTWETPSAQEDPYVQLARQTLERYVRMADRLPVPDGLPAALTSLRAGVFVSLKKDGQLRGCIGTTAPTCVNIAEEIRQNAISAGTRDPRFPPVRPEELDGLTYSVDVLSPSEPADRSELDVSRYGVIVSAGMRSGLLLPCLEGVDTVETQLEIACRKAGIDTDMNYTVERFEVVRHT